MDYNATSHNSSDEVDGFIPMDSLAWPHLVTAAKIPRQDYVELWERSVFEMSLTGEVCQGGLGFVCSEPAVIGGLCWPHFGDDLCRPRPTNSGSDPTTPATVTTPAADDDDATSEYDEAGAPPTEGGDVEGQYESSEVDNYDAAAFDSLENGDPALLLAASIPLPDAEEDDDLEEVDGPAGQPVEPEDTGSTFHLPGVNWLWPSEASVAFLVKKKPKTPALLRIFPPGQGYTESASGRFKCTVRARISPDTGRWEAYGCSQPCKRQYEWRRHFLTIHLAGSRWEDVARQKKEPAEDSTSMAVLAPKKPRAKREPRRAQPSASTSASASTSTAGPQPEVQQRKPRQKRRRQVIEDEESEDGACEDWDQGDSDRKGKKARRW